jgi:hypothetical protein
MRTDFTRATPASHAAPRWLRPIAGACLAASLALLPAAARAQSGGAAPPTAIEPGYAGNFAIDPSFEEDFVNRRGEGHVLSFKGDWYYNQRDLIPDYWGLAEGKFTRGEGDARSGRYYLKLADGQKATQAYPMAVSQEGGGSWSGPEAKPLPVPKLAKFVQPWQASVWTRKGGTISLGGVEAKATGGADWQLLKVTLPAEIVDPA